MGEPQIAPGLATEAVPGQKAAMSDITVPAILQHGTPMTKVSVSRQKPVTLRLDADQGQILYDTKKHRIIPIESIKELRSGSESRYYREQFQLTQELEERWLTIIYICEGRYKTVHVVAPTKDIFRMWDNTLRKLYAIRQEIMSGLGSPEMREALWERQYWKGSDEENDQRLEFENVEKLCKRLNVNSSREDLERLFKQSDVNKQGYLNFEDFQRFVRLLKFRPELDRLYKCICSLNGGTFNFATFDHFMRTSQKSTLSEAEHQKIFVRYATVPERDRPLPPIPPTVETSIPVAVAVNPVPSQSTSTPAPSLPASAPSAIVSTAPTPLAADSTATLVSDGVLTLDGFTSFLSSPDNSAFTDQNGKIWHDMTRPISEYFISSSHNTYLVGHQLVGVSTVEGYIRALLHGCRSVELDIYDGENGPVVYHGKTLTSKVPVRDICQAISRYAFVASPYPVIISAEVHCSLPQQEMMTDIMKEVFGDALVSAPIDGRPKITQLPSPEDLRGRILVKAKNLYVTEHEGVQEKDVTLDTESSSTDVSSSEDVITDVRSEIQELKADLKDLRPNFRGLKSDLRKAKEAMSRVAKSSRPSSVAPTTPRAVTPTPAKDPKAKTKTKMSLSLVSLLVYTVGVKCRGINKKEEYAPEHVFSLSENTMNKILKQGMMDLIKHNRSHLVRIYPKGTRLNSTNYEPHRYWSAGAQLVALNWQTFDLGYMINHAMFQRNGRSGYVLKPKALREYNKEMLGKRTKHFLDVTIISAQQLPRPKDASGREIIDKNIIDPYVEVSVHIPDWTHSPFLPDASVKAYSPASGPSAINATSARTITYKTGVVKNNGFNPVWEDMLSFPFDCVGDMKDLVFVSFAVKQEDKEHDGPLAVYCASLGSLNQGFRHLPLHDAQLSQYLFSTLFVEIGIRDA
ncbi:hypothetical protein JAAARDRAFT_36251 [Jaapia argillacea MUCL 33604]|uniref:Phosphoinositide phospholipase C n=1 Tax=Jaapia argillacea MUCL 33604 TaxID=933084 RepID=A0A067Q2D7_9AGAM|nr:hypothetical protein JAAARDRAFT_36251 [Jaapia argillacea MUCL 33604]